MKRSINDHFLIGVVYMSTIFSGHYQHFNEVGNAVDYNDLTIIDRFYDSARSRYEENSFFPEPIQNEYNHIRDLTSLCISFLCSESNKNISILGVVI